MSVWDGVPSSSCLSWVGGDWVDEKLKRTGWHGQDASLWFSCVSCLFT